MPHNAWLPRSAPTTRDERTPRLFRIGDVAHMLRETTVTLRHWEKEFAVWLQLDHSSTGQRLYSPRMLETLREIQRLLRIELFTIEGAKRQLRLAAERERRAG
jgi:DNA-binding transcriptional MerR regulator